MKVPCEKKKTAVRFKQKELVKKITQITTYANCYWGACAAFFNLLQLQFGICIEISLLIIFIVKKPKAIIHRNGRKNKKRDRFNWEAWYKYVFNNMRLFIKSSDKEKEKTKSIIIEQRKGRWRFRFRMIKKPKICCKIMQQLALRWDMNP